MSFMSSQSKRGHLTSSWLDLHGTNWIGLDCYRGNHLQHWSKKLLADFDIGFYTRQKKDMIYWLLICSRYILYSGD